MLLPPRFMFMEVNQRCNLRCVHCDFWKRDDSDSANYQPRSAKQQMVEEFAELSPHGTVVVCGGEPMLDLEEYFAICRDSRDNGLRVNSVVNGTRIRSAKMADRLVLEGPHEISISFNSQRKDLHDQTRGVAGAFEKASKAIGLLVEARERHPQAGTKIYVMGLISKSNYREIPAFYDFVLNDLGADKLKLNFIQPSFGQSGKTDPFFASETDVDAAELRRIIDECDQRFGLDINPAWLDDVHMYFKSLRGINDLERGWGSRHGTKKHICNTYKRNIMVNHYGVARLCFSIGFKGKQIKTPGDLRAFWEGSNGIRRKMRRCNQFCGISHSVRANSSTLAGQAKGAEFAENCRAEKAKEPRFGAEPSLWAKLRGAF